MAIHSIEAVIISGERRGEIVRLPEATRATDVSDEEVRMLNEALDALIAAVDRVALEVRATVEALRETPGAT
jgi:hypothetical protein